MLRSDAATARRQGVCVRASTAGGQGRQTLPMVWPANTVSSATARVAQVATGSLPYVAWAPPDLCSVLDVRPRLAQSSLPAAGHEPAGRWRESNVLPSGLSFVALLPIGVLTELLHSSLSLAWPARRRAEAGMAAWPDVLPEVS
jgi:hypothetical protein